LRCGYIKKDVAARLDKKFEKVMAMLVSMIRNSQDWTIRDARTD